MISLRTLLQGVSEDDLLAFFLDALNSLGFQATSWGTTSAARIFTQALARTVSDCTYAIADIQAGFFAGLAKGAYADQVGQYQFNLTRVPATQTKGVMLLTSSPAAPSHTWAAGELVIADGDQGSNAHTWQVDAGGTINPGTTLAVNVTALTPGAASNIPPNSSSLQLWTPLVGVGVTNPPQPSATPLNTWITTSGLDAETDGPGGHYNARMLGRWDRIGGGTSSAYVAHCLEALPTLTRIIVREGVAEGTVHIVGATATGGLSPTDITTISNYLTGVTDGISRRMINDVLEIVSANQVTTPALNCTAYVSSQFAATAQAAITQALQDYVSSIPIGGTRVGNASAGSVLISELYRVVMGADGVRNVTFPFGDTVLGSDDIYAPVITVTVLSV